MSFGKKSSTPAPAAPQPVTSPVLQQAAPPNPSPVRSAAAQSRVDDNSTSPSLLGTTEAERQREMAAGGVIG